MATEEQIKDAHEAWRRGEGITGIIDAAAKAATRGDLQDELRKGTRAAVQGLLQASGARRDHLHDQLASIARATVLDYVLRTAVTELRAAVQQGNLPRVVAAIDALERDGRRMTCNHDWQDADDDGRGEGQHQRCTRCGAGQTVEARDADDD